MISPPELGIEDLRGELTVNNSSPRMTLTVPHVVLASTKLAFATKILTDQGEPASGFAVGQNGTTDELEISALSSTGAATLSSTTKANGVVRFGQATEHPISSNASAGPITLDTSDHTVIVDNTGSGTYVLNLPASDAASKGRVYQIKRVNAGGATRQIAVTCQPGDTLDGAGPLNLTSQYDSAVVKADGTGGWWAF